MGAKPKQMKAAAPAASGNSALDEAIKKQGNLVRDLKAKKKAGEATKEECDAAIKKLLELKAEAGASAKGKSSSSNSGSGGNLDSQIKAQGDLVRELKAKKKNGNASNEEVKAAIDKLLALKAQAGGASGGGDAKKDKKKSKKKG